MSNLPEQLSFASPSIPAHTVITCPNCRKELARVIRKIEAGDVVSASHFESIPPQVISNHVPAMSYCCQKPWHLGGMLHTSKGWKP